MPPSACLVVWLFAATCWPRTAQAHLVNTGMGPLYDGVGHFFVSLEELLPLAALCALGGLQGVAGGRRTLFGVPPVWLLAALAGAFFFREPALPPLSGPTLMLALGLMVAANLRLTAGWHGGVVVLSATVLGLSAGTALGAQASAGMMLLGSLIGLSIACTVMVTTVVVLAHDPFIPWRRIGIRILGSWLAGVGLLLLGWQWRG